MDCLQIMPALDQFRLEPPSPASTPTLSEPPTFTDFVGADSCRNALALLFHEQVCYVGICQNNETRLFFPCGNSSFSGMSTDGLVSHSLPHHRFCPTAVSSSFRSPPSPSPFSLFCFFPFSANDHRPGEGEEGEVENCRRRRRRHLRILQIASESTEAKYEFHSGSISTPLPLQTM